MKQNQPKNQHSAQTVASHSRRITHNFICLVDSGKPPHLCHSTKGRYRVGAKNAKQAAQFLQQAIGFGHIRVYYEDNGNTLSDIVAHGECVRETWDKTKKRYDHTPAVHACADRKTV